MLSVSAQRVIGDDGAVQKVDFEGIGVWIVDGDGRTLIDENDNRWASIAPAVERFKRTIVDYVTKERYRPAMADGKPVKTTISLRFTVSCSANAKRPN